METNEEKARELVPTTCGYYEIENALLNMAQWKDEQFEKEKQKLIDKACDFIFENMKCTGYTFQTKIKFIKELKNHMKE